MKIPPQAKKVFEGTVFDVFQWEQEMFDGTTETFEAVRRQPGTQVIATVDGKIVITEEEQPGKPAFYSFLGGMLDGDEEPLEGAKRELLEEAGMASDDWELVRSYDAIGRTDFRFHLFIARNCRVVAAPKLDAGEKITLKYVSFDEFMSILASEKFRGSEIPKDFLSRHYNGTLDEYRNKIFKK